MKTNNETILQPAPENQTASPTCSGSFALTPWKYAGNVTLQSTDDGDQAIPFECFNVESASGGSIILMDTDQMTEREAEHTLALILAAPYLLIALENLRHETHGVAISKTVERQVTDAVNAARMISCQNETSDGADQRAEAFAITLNLWTPS